CCHHRYHLRPLAYYFYQDLIPTNREQVGLPANLFITNQESTRTGEEEDRESEVLIRKMSDREEIAQLYEWMYTNCPSFRFSCYLITSTWGVGFLARLTLILVHLSVNKIVMYGNIILSALTGICILLTIICVVRERKQTIISIERWKQEHLYVQ
ncbi:unnamed protein product, partial [Rotaria magnacalcarata]